MKRAKAGHFSAHFARLNTSKFCMKTTVTMREDGHQSRFGTERYYYTPEKVFW